MERSDDWVVRTRRPNKARTRTKLYDAQEKAKARESNQHKERSDDRTPPTLVGTTKQGMCGGGRDGST